MSRVTGIPCPVCGSTNTYTSSNGRFIHCRAQGHLTDMAQNQGYDDSGGAQRQPQQQGGVFGSFGLR